MDPKIGSPGDHSQERLTAIRSHCSGDVALESPAHLPVDPSLISAPWDLARYNTLPSFEQARASFEQHNGPSLLNDLLAPLFKEWSVESMFGLGLVYRSFTLGKNEKLVWMDNTSTPWTLHEQQKDFDLRIREDAWVLENGRWMPYEFAYDVPTCRTLERAAEQRDVDIFLAELARLLVFHQLDHVLGLRNFAGSDFDGFVEITQGRSNLHFTPVHLTHDWDDEARECAWFFNEPYVRKGRTCRRHVKLSRGMTTSLGLKAISSEERDLDADTLSRPSLKTERVLEWENDADEGIQPGEMPIARRTEGAGSNANRPKGESFSSTLEEADRIFVVEGIEVRECEVVLHRRSPFLPPRPSSH